MDENHPLYDRVKMRAYQLWEERGGVPGRVMDHWDDAIREVLAGWHGDGKDNAPPPSLDGREEPPPQRVGPREDKPATSAETGGTPGATSFDDLGRAGGTRGSPSFSR